jgi:hypothetical protein
VRRDGDPIAGLLEQEPSILARRKRNARDPEPKMSDGVRRLCTKVLDNSETNATRNGKR